VFNGKKAENQGIREENIKKGKFFFYNLSFEQAGAMKMLMSGEKRTVTTKR